MKNELTFRENYFKTEMKDGFVVNELMKRTWAAQLEVLKIIIEICEKHQITYYAYYGTLLGAVRHKGYIPWDDDIDIAMKKEDYIKFLKVAKEELPEQYCILNFYTENEYTNAFTRITNEHGIIFSDKHLNEYHGCPFVVGVDIFPLYYVPREPDQLAGLKALLEAIAVMIDMLNALGEDEATKNQQFLEGLNELECATGYRFTSEKTLLTQLSILFDQVGRLFEEEESDELTIFAEYMKNGYVVKKEWLEESVQIPFENILISVPKNWDAVLEGLFPDYMTPRIQRDTHDYPFYKGQLQELEVYIEKENQEWKKQQKIELPTGWKELVKGKKIVLYHTGAASLLQYSEYVLGKLRDVFWMAQRNPDIILWWVPCLLDVPTVAFIKQMSPKLVKEYGELIEEYCSNNWGICDLTGETERILEIAACYYGDEGVLAQQFRSRGKKVTIQDYEKKEGVCCDEV